MLNKYLRTTIYSTSIQHMHFFNIYGTVFQHLFNIIHPFNNHFAPPTASPRRPILPMEGPVKDTPLALCDPNTVRGEQVVRNTTMGFVKGGRGRKAEIMSCWLMLVSRCQQCWLRDANHVG